MVWGHPHCSSPSSVQLSVKKHSNTPSLAYPSLSVTRLRSQLQTVRSFPSRHLNKSINSTCHSYEIWQPTNGRAGRTARSLYKKGHVFNWRWFNAYTNKKAQQQGTAAPSSRRTSQLPHQEGLGSSVHLSRYIKNGKPALILQGVICRWQPKRSRIVRDNPQGSKRRLTLTLRHLASGQGPAVLPTNITPPRTGDRHAIYELFATHLAAQCHTWPDRAATCLGSTQRNRTAHLPPSRHAVQCSGARLDWQSYDYKRQLKLSIRAYTK